MIAPPLAPDPWDCRRRTPIEREAAIIRSWVMGSSLAEIAEQIGKTPATVRATMRRAAVRNLTHRGVDPELARRLTFRPIEALWEVTVIDTSPPVCIGCATETESLSRLAKGVYACLACISRGEHEGQLTANSVCDSGGDGTG